MPKDGNDSAISTPQRAASAVRGAPRRIRVPIRTRRGGRAPASAASAWSLERSSDSRVKGTFAANPQQLVPVAVGRRYILRLSAGESGPERARRSRHGNGPDALRSDSGPAGCGPTRSRCLLSVRAEPGVHTRRHGTRSRARAEALAPRSGGAGSWRWRPTAVPGLAWVCCPVDDDEPTRAPAGPVNRRVTWADDLTSQVSAVREGLDPVRPNPSFGGIRAAADALCYDASSRLRSLAQASWCSRRIPSSRSRNSLTAAGSGPSPSVRPTE